MQTLSLSYGFARDGAKVLPVDQVLVGDCINVMKGFPEESIDMVMFSPPYWGLRDYGEGTETVWGGSSDCKHEWVEEVCGLVHENRNNLRGSQEEVVGKTGTAWIRKYDQKTVGFCLKCGAWRGQLGLEPNSQMYIAHMVEVCREIKRVLKKTGSVYIVLGDTFMNKQKLGIPWRIRFALNEDGWISRSDIVWHKPNAMPSSVKDRLNTTYEMIFHFVKQEKYYYNLDAIREPHTSLKDLGRKRLDTRTPKHDLAVKIGAGSIGPSGYLVQHPLGKNPGDVMSVTKHDLAVGRVGNFGYTDPLHVKEYHSKGKNPGDVIKGYSPHEPRHFQLSAMEGVKHGGHTGKTVRHDHPLGKNPGDVIRQPKWDDTDPYRTTTAKLHREGYGVGTLHPLGKNPGDVFQAKKEPYVGNNPHRMRLEKGRYVPLNPRRPSDLSHHLGKNPGDTIRCRTDKRLIRDRPLRPPHHPFRGDGWEGINPDMKPHPRGKNPGDVIQEKTWQRAEEFHRKHGKLRSNGTIAGHYLDLSDVAKHYSSKGKNPGDIIKIGMHHGSSLTLGRATHYDGQSIESHPLGSNPGDFWSINTKPFRGAHFAVYPEEICVKPILSSCPTNGIVLDPMCGSGTTLAVAKKLGRKYIGIDLNPHYVDIAIERLLKIGSFDRGSVSRSV